MMNKALYFGIKVMIIEMLAELALILGPGGGYAIVEKKDLEEAR